MYELKSQKAVDFFNRNTHLDFESMVCILVDILEKLQTNIDKEANISKTTFILQEFGEKLNKLDKKVNSSEEQLKSMHDSFTHFLSDISCIMANNKDNLIHSIRDSLQASSSQSGQDLTQLIRENHELFMLKINNSFDNKHLQEFISQEINKTNHFILEWKEDRVILFI